MSTELSDLYTFPKGIQTRWASAENPKGEKGAGGRSGDGRKGSPCIAPLKAGASIVLAEVAGVSGTIRRIWITIDNRDPVMLRGLRLEMYWDGSKTAAVSVPIGDFFCNGLGRMSTFQNALFASPEGRSFNCYIPMPFKTGMKITATNETDTDLAMLFYDVDYTVGDAHGPDTLYFHAHWRRENPTTLMKDYEMLPALNGRGRFLGVNAGVIADMGTYFKSWWGEGEVKVYLDDDTELPTLCGTGTEDYIGTGWGQGQYANTYQGCQLADHERYQYCFYRLHIPDPIFFQKNIRVTIQQIGFRGAEDTGKMRTAGLQLSLGKKQLDMDKNNDLFERRDDWSSCAYFYLERPENGLPPLASLGQRIENLKKYESQL